MSYVDSLLADGEDIVLRTRQHWLALLARPRRGWLLLLLALVALLLGLVVGGDATVRPRAEVGQVLYLLAFALLLLGLLAFLVHSWRWVSEAYLITNRRVLQVQGIVNKRAADTSLEKINDAVLYQGLAGRIFGYGDLDVLTASESAIDRFRLLRDAPGFKRTMLNQKHELERDLAFRPSPPVRLGGPAAGASAAGSMSRGATAGDQEPSSAASGSAWSSSGAAGHGAGSAWSSSGGVGPVGGPDRVGAPPGVQGIRNPGSAPRYSAPPRTEMSDALIVTQTLARLAELRDRGAISEEEYQAKKVELLQRL